MASIPAPQSGPYVQAAAIAEKVLTDADGVVSLIRIVDRVVVSATGPEPPAQMPPQQLNYTIVVSLKSGQAQGRHSLKLRPEAPNGEQRAAIEVDLNLEGADRGNNIFVGLQGFPFDQEGLWWFDVLFGDNETLLTRIPLRLMYQPQRVAQAGQTGSP
jgi:uncharacterized protein DUF6941